jgi:hypothetical protein
MSTNNTVTIEKWVLDKNTTRYMIIDSDGHPMDGFSKLYQAIDAINGRGLVRKDKSIKIRK